MSPLRSDLPAVPSGGDRDTRLIIRLALRWLSHVHPARQTVSVGAFIPRLGDWCRQTRRHRTLGTCRRLPQDLAHVRGRSLHRQDDSRPHLPAHPGRSRSSQWLSRQLYSDRHDLIISGRRIAGLVTISGGGGRRAARPRQRLRNGQRPSRRARPPPGTGPSFEPATAGERLAAGRRSMWRARLRSPGRHGHTGPATARRSGP